LKHRAVWGRWHEPVSALFADDRHQLLAVAAQLHPNGRQDDRIPPQRFSCPFDQIYFLAVLVNFMLAITDVLARFMADQFAERIWHLAAQRFVYFLVGAPLIMISLMSIFEDAIRVRVNNSWVSPKLLAEFQRHPEPVWHYIGGMGQAVIAFALLAPTIFICIYKWQLWRDSR
jgi:hypothetical protein